MIVLNGTIRLPADKLDAARPLLKTLIEETNKEDGCLYYRFGQDVLDPSLIVISEAWRDEDAVRAHLGAPHFIAWRDAGATFEVTDRQLTIYEVSSSKPL